MVTFVHTGDWQLGMTRRWLRGEAQARFADARLEAVRSIGAVARREGADFVVVAGDVFEANQLSGQTVGRALEALREVPVPVYLLPGNHDPLEALSIYRSRQFVRDCPDHVHVLDETGPHQVSDGVELLAGPWESKHPDADPLTAALDAAGSADGTLRILVGHGIVDVLDPDRDNRAAIATAPLETALEQGRIHYVALGDRHSRTCVGESGAIWYAGSPEVTDPREQAPGDVLVVRLEAGSDAAARVVPQVEPHRVGTWDFRVISRELTGAADVAALDRELAALGRKDRTVVKLALRGALTVPEHAELERVKQRHAQVLAALHDWERHTRVRVTAGSDDLTALGLSGFVAAAAEEMRVLVSEERGAPYAPEGAGAGGEGPEEHPAVEPGEQPTCGLESDLPESDPAASELLGWDFEPLRPVDAASAAGALALLHRLTADGAA